MAKRVGYRIDGSVKVSGAQNRHGFDRELALGEYHDATAIDSSQSAMNIHSMLRDMKHRIQEHLIGGGELRVRVVVSVKAKGNPVGVRLDASGRSGRIASKVMGYKRYARMEMVLLHQFQ